VNEYAHHNHKKCKGDEQSKLHVAKHYVENLCKKGLRYISLCWIKIVLIMLGIQV